MAHSVEVLFDPDTDATVREDWAALAEAGLPSQAFHRGASNRPHVTLTVAERIEATVDTELWLQAKQLPLDCRIGAPIVFGRSTLTLARLIVPSAALLRLHESVGATCAPHLSSDPFPHALPGQWTPHVTLCRRLKPTDLAEALRVIGADDVEGTFAELRRWDGDARADTVIA